MKILSIDVGIKNLAFCLFDKTDGHFKITKWDTINISNKEDNLKCQFIEKNIICNKPAKFKKNDECFCLKHAKKHAILQMPKSEQKPAFINKQKLQKLYEIANKQKILYDPKIKKIDLIKLIIEYNSKFFLEPIECQKANDVDLFNIGLNIKTKFNKLFENEESIEYVIIENQISPIATRMKTIQGMLVQYFIMSNLNVHHIDFISAANKLKDCDVKDKSKYSDRKKLGIAKCLEKITDDNRFSEHIEYFNTHKKKDDLSDSFLQGIWFINNKQL